MKENARFFQDALWINGCCLLAVLSFGYFWPSKQLLKYYVGNSIVSLLDTICTAFKQDHQYAHYTF